MPKFERLFLLKLSPDAVIHASATLYFEWTQVPESRKWSTQDSPGWNKLEPHCLHKTFNKDYPTIKDKMMIIAHGTETEIGEEGDGEGMGTFPPAVLAAKLKRWGIKEVGLITFKCCNLGKGNFLNDFVNAAGTNGIQIGWVKGYTGGAATNKSMFIGKPSESITRPMSFMGVQMDVPVVGSDRFKIVKGTLPFNVPDSRYLLDSDDK
jgi:hypothetical protein